MRACVLRVDTACSYIGMTTGMLHDREHTTAVPDHSPSSAFGEHYSACHPNSNPSMGFTIISQQRDILHLHIEEAFAVQTQLPTPYRRQEHLGLASSSELQHFPSKFEITRTSHLVNALSV